MLKKLNVKLEQLQETIEKTNCQVDDFKLEKKRLKNYVHKLQSKLWICKGKDIIKLQTEYDILHGNFLDLKREHKEVEQLIEVINSADIVTFADGRFTNEIRRTVMELVSLNVSINKISDVIKAVLGNMTKTDVSYMRLPSDGAKKRMVEEALILAQLQVAEAMKENNELLFGNCLHGDGTSKYSRHYQNFQITTKSGRTPSFSLTEVADADAETVLITFTGSVKDICDAIDGDKEKDFSLLVASIKNTMSDLGPVNPLFNSKLEIIRSELLPKVMSNWDELEDIQKGEIIRMGSFLCKLHLLCKFSTQTGKSLKEFEYIILDKDYEKQFAFNTKESSPTQLIRIACKAFHPRGSDECGVASYFNAFLSNRDQSNLFASFIGNRFNILYYNASALYFLKDAIKDFIEEWPEPNKLIKSVDELMQNPFNMACVRALGIVDKIVTGPFWRIVEHVDSILKINPYLETLKLQLDSLRQDANPSLHGHLFFDENDDLVKIDRDNVYDELFRNTQNEEFEVLTCQALEEIFVAMLTIVERQAKDQGGIYDNHSDEVIESASIVPAHNKASESDFAILDLLIRMKPSANVETLQTITMLHRNKTIGWLNMMSEKERDDLLNKSRKLSDEMKIKYNERRESVFKRKKEIVQERQNLKKELESKAPSKKTTAVNALLENGVMAWISVEIATKNIETIDESKRLAVIDAQLMFYKHVLLSGRKCHHTLFTKSSK